MLKENRSASHWMPEYAILGNKTDMLLSRNSKKALIQCYILFMFLSLISVRSLFFENVDFGNHEVAFRE